VSFIVYPKCHPVKRDWGYFVSLQISFHMQLTGQLEPLDRRYAYAALEDVCQLMK